MLLAAALAWVFVCAFPAPRQPLGLAADGHPAQYATLGPSALLAVPPPPEFLPIPHRLMAASPASSDATWVRAENGRPGTPGWRITNIASAGEIQAYAGQTSVNAGDTIDFYVSTRQAGLGYGIDFYRMGWYGGAGALLATSVSGLTGKAQGFYTPATGLIGCSRCRVDPATGLVDANWLPSYTLSVPKDWLSGVYLARLTATSGKQTYVPFVVRQDGRTSALVLKLSVNTYEAYNAWGGKSLYSYNSKGAKTDGGTAAAVKVSFNRPFDADNGAGQFLEYDDNLVRWIERTGYDVSYLTDVDTAADGSLLLQHRGFISAGHDEYWTAEERQNVRQARTAGIDLAFLSGDAVYWQARYEPSAGGSPNRTLVEYRGSADPSFSADPAHATVRFQDPPLNAPENMLTGTIYSAQAEPFTQDWVAQNTDSWVFAGTGLKPGDHVPGLVGKEFDCAASSGPAPEGLQVLSHSPATVTADDRPPNVAYADTTIYTASSGAVVFSAGTVTWSWGLDDAPSALGSLRRTPVSPAIQRLTQNLLDRFVSGPIAPS
jgi:hypothetical protein